MDAEYGLLACWCPIDAPTISPLMQGQAAVVARHGLNQMAHQPDAMKHDYIHHDGSKR